MSQPKPRTQVVEREGIDYLKMNLYGKDVELKIDGYQDPSDKSRGQIVSIAEILAKLKGSTDENAVAPQPPTR